jgi:hypothetical protein
VIAALNSVEPFAQNVALLDAFYAGEAWTKEFRPKAEALLEKRLIALADWLGGKEYLEGRFTAGDLMLSDVLRTLQKSGILARFPAARRLPAPLHRAPRVRPRDGSPTRAVPRTCARVIRSAKGANDAPPCGFRRRMDRRPQAPSGKGEGVHPPAR